MRFRRLRIDAFGGLAGLDTGPDPLDDLVVVHGPNEAGKSTFFHFLTSLLYGFYPASREGNPFSPWDGGTASGGADIVLDDGTRLEVHRRLLSSPAGTVTARGRTEELRNRTLSVAEHVPLGVFRQVFALTLGDLAALEGESWARVQDRLVTGLGASDLRPPREVADELEAEAGRLWRPSQRGNQRVRDLDERARELTVRRRAAAERDRSVREADRELARVRQELASARREREACRLYVERYRALLPIRRQLERVRDLEEEAGPPEEIAGLPESPLERLEELARRERRLAARLEEIDEALDDAEARAAAYDDDARRLLERKDRVRALVGRVAGLEPVRVRMGQLEQEGRDLERAARALAAELLEARMDEVDPDELAAVAPGRVRSAVDRHATAAEASRRARDAVDRGPGDGSGPPLTPLGTAVLVVGAILTGFGLVEQLAAVAAAGALVAALGAALVGAGLAGVRRGGRRATEAARKRLEAARREEESSRADVRAALGALPVRSELLERPGADLPTRLERLQELVRDRLDREAALRSLRERVDDVRRDVGALADELGRSLPEQPAAAAHVLEQATRDAQRAADVAEVAERERERLERERRRVEAEHEDARKAEETVRARLTELGGGDPQRGGAVAGARVRARERARQLREELERNHHDLDEIRTRIEEAEAAGEDWTIDDDALARSRAREEELIQKIEELSRRAEGLEKDMAHRREGATVDEVEGELRAVRDRIEEATRERDRLWLLAAILRQAERRFREDHQPDILRDAGAHLGAITGGRYSRLLLDEDRARATFRLKAPEYPGPVEVGEPVSTGTREQVYLALRLAVLDHLDRGGERMPFFLDETVVNWDPERRARTFGLLSDVARHRQVFFFTCHDRMARELEERGGRRLGLPGPP